MRHAHSLNALWFIVHYYHKEATCCKRNNEPVSVRQKQNVRRSVAQRSGVHYSFDHIGEEI